MNRRPSGPKPDALARLRYAPKTLVLIAAAKWEAALAAAISTRVFGA